MALIFEFELPVACFDRNEIKGWVLKGAYQDLITGVQVMEITKVVVVIRYNSDSDS